MTEENIPNLENLNFAREKFPEISEGHDREVSRKLEEQVYGDVKMDSKKVMTNTSALEDLQSIIASECVPEILREKAKVALSKLV